MAEVALQQLGRPTELWEIYDHIVSLGYQPGNHLSGMAELGATLYRSRDKFTPLDEETWTLASWDKARGHEEEVTQPSPDLAQSVRDLLFEERGAVMLKTITNRLASLFDVPPTTLEVLEVLKSGDDFELVSPGRYALRGTAPTDPALALWLPDAPEAATPSEPVIRVEEDDVDRVTLLLSHYGRLMPVEEIAQEAVNLRHRRDADPAWAQAVIDAAPERFIRIKEKHYGLAEWEGSAKALLLGSGWQRAVAALLHEHLWSQRRGEDAQALVVTLGNDQRWPASAPKTLTTVEGILQRNDHVFMSITRRRAGEQKASREVWTLQPYARDAAPIAPRPLAPGPVHPLGASVPMEMPHPNPLIRNETARLAHVALRHLARSATVEEVTDLMLSKLLWQPKGEPQQLVANALEQHKDLFRRARAGRYYVRRAT